MTEDCCDFGSLLRRYRVAAGLSQEELAERAGLSRRGVSDLERGLRRRPYAWTAERLAQALGLGTAERVALSAARRTPLPAALSASDPPLQSRLPTQLAPFFGRDAELAEIRRLLAATRLVTLYGVGGVGKTRLAIEAVSNLARPEFGIHFVALAGVGSSDLLPLAIATTLEVPIGGSGAVLEHVVRYLEHRSALLLLDNFEHVLDATGVLSEILARAAGVKLLVTSRERLNLRDEWAVRVEGLPFPDERVRAPTQEYPAVELFVERARHIEPNFALADCAAHVASICRRVEGMPLALELVATWLRVLSCEQIAQDVARDLALFSTPHRDVPERHRTLCRVFDWSWSLLSETEKATLAALAVFRGGFDREGADSVADASLLVLGTLADKSFIKPTGRDRYDLHKLVQQYLLEKLDELERTSIVRRAHVDYFVKLVTYAETQLHGPDQQLWFDRMELEADNINAALAWTVEHKESDVGLRLAGAMEFFWEQRNPARLIDGCARIEQLLALGADRAPAVRAKALRCLAKGAWYWGDERRGHARSEDSLARARAAGDTSGIAWALADSGFFGATDLRRAAARLESALQMFRNQHHGFGMNHVLRRLAWNLTTQGKHDRARHLLEEALAESRSSGDPQAQAWSLYLLGNLTWLQTDEPSAAEPLYRDALALSDQIKDKAHRFYVLCMLGHTMRAQADYDNALDLFDECVATVPVEADGWSMWAHGQRIACQAARSRSTGQFEHAAYLIGAAVSMLQTARLQAMPRADVMLAKREVAREVAAIRAALHDRAFGNAFAAGQALPPRDIVAELNLGEARRRL